MNLQRTNEQQPVTLTKRKSSVPWLNRTVLAVGFASFFSDWSHETATTVMPAFLATLGVSAAWLGLIEGVSDGLSSFAKLASGFYTDRLRRRKPIAVAGYVLTALGTASFALATSAWHVLVGRALAWFGRGVRTPVRKALVSGSVDRETYGRAFGFERMMDTAGAIAGPATALLLLTALNHRYAPLFALTLIPGLLAAVCIGVGITERERKPVAHVSFGRSLHSLPVPFRRFLVAVGLFGLGDFAHSLFILLATQKLTPVLGPARAASVAVGLYVLHNVCYAGFAFVAGWLGDRWDKRRLLAAGYGLAAVNAVAIIVLPMTPVTLVIVFILAGTYVAVEDTLEDALSAELTEEAQHGMAFGVLATVNGVGDFASSIVVGALWTAAGTGVALGYSAVLFAAGALLVLRIRTAPSAGPA